MPNFLEVIGAVTLVVIFSFLFYIVIIDPIIETVKAYRYNKLVDRLGEKRAEIHYYFDKIYALTNKRLSVEKVLNNPKILEEFYEEYKKNSEIIIEEVQASICDTLESNNINELSQRAQEARIKIREIKTKLGLT